MKSHRGPAAVIGDERHEWPFAARASVPMHRGRVAEKAWSVGRSVSQKTCRLSVIGDVALSEMGRRSDVASGFGARSAVDRVR